VERNRKAGQNPPRVVAPSEEEEVEEEEVEEEEIEEEEEEDTISDSDISEAPPKISLL
jgi:hypothetical protein